VNKRSGLTSIKQQEIEVLDGQISVIQSTANIEVRKIIEQGNVEAKKIRSELEA